MPIRFYKIHDQIEQPAPVSAEHLREDQVDEAERLRRLKARMAESPTGPHCNCYKGGYIACATPECKNA